MRLVRSESGVYPKLCIVLQDRSTRRENAAAVKWPCLDRVNLYGNIDAVPFNKGDFLCH